MANSPMPLPPPLNPSSHLAPCGSSSACPSSWVLCLMGLQGFHEDHSASKHLDWTEQSWGRPDGQTQPQSREVVCWCLERPIVLVSLPGVSRAKEGRSDRWAQPLCPP